MRTSKTFVSRHSVIKRPSLSVSSALPRTSKCRRKIQSATQLMRGQHRNSFLSTGFLSISAICLNRESPVKPVATPIASAAKGFPTRDSQHVLHPLTSRELGDRGASPFVPGLVFLNLARRIFAKSPQALRLPRLPASRPIER